jgi:probable O-glycosylation ligase (exosortase A-associated)
VADVVTGNQNTSIGWWRREAPVRHQSAAALETPDSSDASSRFAFRALVVFTIVLVAAPQEFVPALVNFRIAFLAALAALAAYCASRLGRAHSPRPLAREVTIVICLVGWAILTIPRSYWPGGSLSVLTDQYLKAVVVFWLLGEVVNTVERLHTLMWTLSVLTIPLALSGLRSYAMSAFLDGSDRIAGYVGGMTSNPNDLALMLNIILPLTASLALCARRWTSRFFALALVGLSIATIVVTFSRAGFLAMAVICTLFLGKLAARGAWGLIGAIVAAAVLAVVLLPSGYAQRLQTITNVDSDPTGSSQERWTDTVAATEFLLKHPLTGAGLGMDILALNEMRGATWLHVHDIYLHYGVDLGVPGLALFVALLATSIRSAKSVERGVHDPEARHDLSTLAAGVRIGLWGFVLSGFFYPVAYHFYFYYLSGLAVALRTISWSAPSKDVVTPLPGY